MEPMRWQTSGRRLLAAAAAAVAIHLLLALCLSFWSRARPKAPARAAPPITITLQERSGPAGVAPLPPGRAEPAKSAVVPHAPRTRSAPTTRLAEGVEGENPRNAPARPADRGPLTKDETASEGLAHEPGDRPVTTTLRDPLATLDPHGGPRPEPRQGPVHVPTREDALVEEKTRVESTVRGWTDDVLARSRAEDPHDVYWHDMQETLARNFEVDFDISKRQDDRPTSSFREAAAAYQRAAESSGRTGTAYGEVKAGTAGDRGFAGTPLEGAKAAADVSLLAQAAFGEGGQWNKKLVVLIQIVQGPDGTESRFGAQWLRARCPCGGCVDEWSGKRTVGEAQIKPGVRAQNLEPVGRYAARLQWSDGHDAGIYSWDLLLELRREQEA